MEERFLTGRIAAILYSSPNNPSWICLKDSELKGIGELCTKYGVIALEDLAYFGMDFREEYGIPYQPPYQPTVANTSSRRVMPCQVRLSASGNTSVSNSVPSVS